MSVLHTDPSTRFAADSQPADPAILLIGDVTAPAFRRVHSRFSASDCQHAPTLRAALELVDSCSPDLVVVWQGVPDEYPQSQAMELIGRLPLARWVVVFGPWCESIGRTEQLWPNAWSVPVRHAATRIQEELQRLQNGEPPLAATMSRDETFATHHTLPATAVSPERRLSANISGDDTAFCEFLSDALAAMGVQVTDSDDAPLQILHISVPDSRTSDRIRSHRNQSPDSSVIVVSELITPQTEQSLLQAGANAVLTQLRFTSELAAWLRTE